VAAVANVKVGHSQGAQYQTGQCQDWPLGDVGQGATAPLPPYRALVYISGRIADERGPGMLPILYFIDQYLIDLFIWVIIGSAILSWLIAFNVVNPYNQFVRSLWDLFNRITEPFLRPIRRMLPDMGGIDVSPVVLILILVFIRVVVIRGWLMPLFS
jgi:YggT family protein